MILRPATAADLGALARVHGAAFDVAWSAKDLGALLDGPGCAALMALEDQAVGFILARIVADEAEILTLAVDPAARRRGVGAALVAGACAWSQAAGAQILFLEVAADNAAALALYGASGFEAAGRRRDYYMRPCGAAVDAVVMRRALNSGKA